MSALAPLYLLGALAVIAPIVFHLIRRAPRGEVPFSSLMFLAPSPPRLTRRSRLDNILLLLLRALALCLLAFAFARPFLREQALWDPGGETPTRTAILIDTSASMRRGELWKRAREAARKAADECGPADELAVIAFDRTTRPVLDFRESSSLDAARRPAAARQRIDQLQPGWCGTDLGQALIDTVAAIEDVADSSQKRARMPRRIVLVTDLQQGSRLAALGEFEWPSDVELVVKTVADDSSNAGLQRLPEPAESEGGEAARDPRVRVNNDSESKRERFTLEWIGAAGTAIGEPTDVYVPPGESRVVRVPRPRVPGVTKGIMLRGDAAPFDNTLHIEDEPRREDTVLVLSNDRADDPSGLLYYLMRVFVDTPRRTVKVAAQPLTAPIAVEPSQAVPLMILTGPTSAENVKKLVESARSGTTLLYVATRADSGATLAGLTGSPARPIEEATPPRDMLLGEIAFDHPLFAPFAGPQYSDFTRIHFWKHRKVPGASTVSADPGSTRADEQASAPRERILARFENGDPAVIERSIGKGSLVILASGWSPDDSQLARSSKFVPLMMALLDRHDPRPFDAREHLVGDTITLPAPEEAGHGLVVKKPSGGSVELAPGATRFTTADEPGIYTVAGAPGPRSFVVNIDPSESKTAPSAVETLEQYGCRLAKPERKAIDRDQLRQMHNVELEGRQKLWRWLILATVGLLIVETGLAGRLGRARTESSRSEASRS